MPAALWTGALSFGLVSIPVALTSAVGSQHSVVFRTYHQRDMGAVRIRKHCGIDDELLDDSQITRGYTAPDGRVALVTDDDLVDLPLPTAHTIAVTGFLPLADVDPVRWRRPYLLQARVGGAKPYVVMREALRRAAKAAVGKVSMRGREVLVLIHPYEDALVLRTLYWPDEIRPTHGLAPTRPVALADEELDAAVELIDAIGPADLDDIRDAYQDALQQLVTAKLEGAPLPAAEPVPATPAVDIMAALRQSIDDAKRAKHPAKRRTRGRTKAPAGSGRR
ncbi:MAG: Ku protein [Streptomycetaceae bacterium]|nr:Ku protein [Streptomycetaceae bacterium]